MLIVLSVLSVLFLTLGVSILRAFSVNPETVHITYKSVVSSKLPSSLNPVSVVYFSDLEYGHFETPERAETLITQAADLKPDLFLFGGDLFAQEAEVDENMKATMTELLSSIQAPLGKYAVLGEQDTFSEARKNTVLSVYQAAGIEVLTDSTRLITNQSAASFQLCGLSLEPDYAAVSESIVPSQFCLLFAHYPDALLSDVLRTSLPDLALAGNAHGTQITWPLLGGYKDWPGSTQFNRARSARTGFDTYLTSGTGCIEVDARLNSPVEIVYLLLSSS